MLLLGLGVATIVVLLLFTHQFEQRLERDSQGIDLVVGAKGSPLQLILSSVYHVDIPTGNIPLQDAEKLKTNPLIKATVPLALGDSYEGFRIVGTNHDYVSLYDGKTAEAGCGRSLTKRCWAARSLRTPGSSRRQVRRQPRHRRGGGEARALAVHRS